MRTTLPQLAANDARWLRPSQVAERLNVTLDTLDQWRRKGTGPLPLKLGSARNSPVRYAADDVADWENSSEGQALIAAGQRQCSVCCSPGPLQGDVCADRAACETRMVPLFGARDLAVHAGGNA